LLLELFQPGLEVYQLSGLMGLLCVVIFRDADDNVHHIRYTPAALGATVQLTINLCGHNKLPRICAQQIEDDILDLPGRDHIALTDEHERSTAGLMPGIKRLH
jgi:hypothetical protein